MNEEKEFHFDFCVYGPGLDYAATQALWEAIVALIESRGAFVGGGFSELEQEAGDGQAGQRN